MSITLDMTKDELDEVAIAVGYGFLDTEQSHFNPQYIPACKKFLECVYPKTEIGVCSICGAVVECYHEYEFLVRVLDCEPIHKRCHAQAIEKYGEEIAFLPKWEMKTPAPAGN
jgi:hypothetical protein